MSGFFLVHAVMHAGVELPPTEPVIGGTRLTLVTEGALAALVSVLASDADQAIFADPEKAAEIGVRHHAALTSLAEVIDLAPVRLGAVYADEQAVIAMLKDNATSFSDALAHIAGSAEFAMKLVPAPVADAPRMEAGLSGRGFLQRRADASAAQRNRAERARRIASQIFEIVVTCAKDNVFASPRRNAQADQDKRLLDAALLVRRAEIAGLVKAVSVAQEIAEAEGFRLTVVGPLPAYSFVMKSTDTELAA